MRDMTARFGDAWSHWAHNQEAEGDKCYSSTCCLLFTVRNPNLGDGACHIQAGSSFLRESSLEAASQTDTQQYTSYKLLCLVTLQMNTNNHSAAEVYV